MRIQYKNKKVSRSVKIFVGAIGLSFVVYWLADISPWPVYGAAGFIWGALLLLVGVGYLYKCRHLLTRNEIKLGLLLAIIGWFIPLILNHILNIPIWHKFHKLLAFIAAFLVLVVYVNAKTSNKS